MIAAEKIIYGPITGIEEGEDLGPVGEATLNRILQIVGDKKLAGG